MANQQDRDQPDQRKQNQGQQSQQSDRENRQPGQQQPGQQTDRQNQQSNQQDPNRRQQGGSSGKMTKARAKVDNGDNRVASAAVDETPKVAKISTSARHVGTAVRRCGSHPSRSAGRASFELTAQTEGRGNAPALVLFALAGVG